MPKKTKAIKVSDRKGNKPWLKKVGIGNYLIETREKRRRFLIVCEGQTEELYFKSFPVLTADIKSIHQGCSKRSLVECTKAYLLDEEYDEVWCVFDMDVKPDIEGQFDDFNAAIVEATKLNFKCAYSNDAFELWFVLHYEFIDQEHNRTFFYQKLSGHWRMNYEKHGKVREFAKTIYTILQDDKKASQLQAIKFSEKLHKEKRALPYHQQNPVTTVYELVTILNKHLRE